MSLTVVVKSASSLPNLERFSKSDPMAVLIFLGKEIEPFFAIFFLIICRSQAKDKVMWCLPQYYCIYNYYNMVRCYSPIICRVSMYHRSSTCVFVLLQCAHAGSTALNLHFYM